MRSAALVAAVYMLAGCGNFLPHDVKDIQWKADAKKWAGTYTFSECAPASQVPEGGSAPCWKYVFVVDGEADAIVSVDGPQAPPRVKGTARVHREGKLDFIFDSYADEKVDVADIGLHAFDPLRGRYTPGSPLANITRDATGRPCVTFESMDSKLATKTLCTSPALVP